MKPQKKAVTPKDDGIDYWQSLLEATVIVVTVVLLLLCFAALWATLRLIGETLFFVEFLFSVCEDEFL
jgi:hypothetical protein